MARRAIALVIAAAGAGALVASLLYMLPEIRAEAAFRGLSDEARLSPAEGGGVDWSVLDGYSDDVVAYLTVDNTNVDYPVAQSSDNEYYLWRGLDGQPNGTGTPFMDYRCPSPDSRNVIVYGHHMGSSHTVFDALSAAYDQASFDGLGTVRWVTRDEGETDFRPAFAMRVYKDYSKPFRFSFATEGGPAAPGQPPAPRQEADGDGDPAFPEWLAAMLSDASASCADAEALAAHSARSLTLVTCSEQQGGQPWRCLLVCLPEPRVSP